MADEQNQQTVRYRLTVDQSDVHSSIAEIQGAADRAASSVSAMASNMLSTLRGMTGDSFGIAQGAVRDLASMSYANAPRPSMTSMGASMVGPTGLPSINLFRPGAYGGGYGYQFPYTPSNAPYFAPPVSPLLHPNSPVVQAQARNLFSRGDGGFGNIGQSLYRLFMQGQGAIAGTSNLDESVYETVSRRSEAFGRNAGNFLAGDLPGLGMMAAGMMMGGPAGLIAGAVGAPLAGMGIRAIEHFARPYAEGADIFRERTAPYIQGSRLGPGLSARETVQTQRRLMDMAQHDKYFTAKDYRDIIEMSSESGVFQFTGSQQQAERAIEKMAENVKTLHTLGVKSRDMLKSLDKLMGGMGINIGSDTQSVANVATYAAVTGRMAGIDTATNLERAQMTAQQFASQGLHPAFGGKVGMFNQGMAGGIARSGLGAGFIAAYFGGQEGLADSLNASYGAMARTPFGQMQLLARYGAGMRGPMSINNMLGSLGNLAKDPYEFLAQQAFMPMLTKNASATDALEMFRDQLGELKNITGQTDARKLLAVFSQMNPGVDIQALALQLAGAGDVSANMRKQIMDQQNMLALESKRALGLDRSVEKFKERLFAPLASAGTNFRMFQAGLGEAYEEWTTGQSYVNLGRAGVVGLDPMKANEQAKLGARLSAAGFDLPAYTPSSEDVRKLQVDGSINQARRLYDSNALFKEDFGRLNRESGGALHRVMHGSASGMSSEERNRHIATIKDAVGKFEKSQERNFDTMRGMSRWQDLTYQDQDNLRRDVSALMQSEDVRGKVMSALSRDFKGGTEQRLLGLKMGLMGKSKLNEEEGQRFGQLLMALDVGGHFTGEGQVLNTLQKNLHKVATNKGLGEAELILKERDTQINRIGNRQGGDFRFGSHDQDGIAKAKTILGKGGKTAIGLLESATIKEMASSMLSKGAGGRRAWLDQVKKAFGTTDDAEVFRRLKLDPNASNEDIMRALQSRFTAGGEMEQLAKAEGTTLADLNTAAAALANDANHNLTLLRDIGEKTSLAADAAARGGDENFGVSLAAAMKMAPGYNPADMQKLESALGSSVEKYLGHGEGMTNKSRLDKLKRLAGTMHQTGAGANYVDGATLNKISTMSVDDILLTYGGQDKDSLAQLKDEEHKAMLASMAIKNKLAPQNYGEQVSLGKTGALMPGGQQVAGMNAAMGELSGAMSVLSEITQNVDTSKLEKMLKVMEAGGATFENRETKVNTMTVKVDSLVIEEKGKKVGAGGFGLRSDKPLNTNLGGQGSGTQPDAPH